MPRMPMEEIMSSPSSEITSMRTTILKAGAGAGKTTTLIRLFEDVALDFYKAHKRFPKIVLTTFTRKATQEIRERLLTAALKKDQPAMFRFINQRSRVHISTIHGVLSLFLSQFGKELGLAPEFELATPSEIQFRQRRILKDLLLKNADWLELIEVYEISNLLSMLDQYYQQHFLNENMQVIGPEELKNLSQNILKDISHKGFHFFETISSNPLSESWREYLAPFATLKSPQTVTVEGLRSLFNNLGRKPPFNKKRPAFDESLHEDFKEFLEDSKKSVELESLQDSFISRHTQLAEKFDSLAKSFCEMTFKERLEDSVLGMSDLEAFSLCLIRRFPWTAKKFSTQWDYWMIDEYQDTSPLQVELLQHLVGGKPHFIVGDPQQSIYLFRGARSDVFHNKVNEIQTAGGDVKSALTNYRSTAPLLEFINSYFSNNPAFSKMVPFKSDSPDNLCAEALIIDGGENAFEAEKAAILGLIQEKLDQGVPAQEICVLSRTNRILEDLAQMAFSSGLPVQLHSAGKFSSRREVLDFLAIMKFLVNPHDNLNFLSVLRSPWFRLPDSKILVLTEIPRASVWSNWNNHLADFENATLAELKNYRDLCEKIGLSETMGRILKDKRLIDSSKSLDPSGRREANLWKIYIELKNKESVAGFNPLQFVDEYENRSDSQDEGDATPVVEPDRVNLMTIHASKGLQFGHVILAGFGGVPRSSQSDWWMLDEETSRWTLALRGLDQQRIASLWGNKIAEQNRKREAEESDRVLYVAMTRAKEFLSFVWCLGPRRGSWASSFPFSTQAGIHNLGNFSFEVRNEISSMRQSLIENSKSISVRPPYSVAKSIEEESRHTKVQDLKFILEGTQKSAEFYHFFKALKFRPEIWEITPPEYLNVVDFLKNLKEIPFQKILSQGEIDWGMTVQKNGQRTRLELDLWSQFDNQAWLVSFKMGSGKDSETVIKELEKTAALLKSAQIISQSEVINLLILYPNKREFIKRTYSSYETPKPM